NGTKSERIVLRNNRARGVAMKIQWRGDDGERSFVEVPLNCPGEERIYSAVTGGLVSKRSLHEAEEAPTPPSDPSGDRDQP
ncbi:MAG: hypothetical protein ACPGPE_16485, partial [Planctomycetota bacterium]